MAMLLKSLEIFSLQGPGGKWGGGAEGEGVEMKPRISDIFVSCQLRTKNPEGIDEKALKL